MISGYLRELAARLDDFRVPPSLARRLLAEAHDHLEEASGRIGEEQAVRSFGAPEELAAVAAAELATAWTRKAAFATFTVLAPAGAAYAALFATLSQAGPLDIAAGNDPGLGLAGLLGVVFFPQLAFVAGSLGALRAWRLQGRRSLSAAELQVQRWRFAVAIGAGLLTFASLAVVAVEFRQDLARWWVVSSLLASGAVALLLAPVAVAGVRSSRPVVRVTGQAESLFDDLDDLVGRVPGCRHVHLRRNSRGLALVVAVAAATAVALAGVSANDPFDGLVRGLFEGLAVTGCYLTLGRRLGLKS
jgi:hypothetical protein